MDNWDEVRTAYQVAKMGTVSGAAEVLGVHHATVIRHVDALETRLGVKLFQRHARGYTATEAGEDLCRVAQATDEQFSQLVGRVKGKGDEVSGELVVTSLNGLAPLMSPTLTAFQQKFPDLTLRYLTGERLFRLEYGEAHVAIRAGAAPDQPDNVVQSFVSQSVALYASQSYVDVHGMPADESEYARHRFVGHDLDTSRAPFFKWLGANVPRANVVFRSTDNRAMELAICAGAGIGFMTETDAASHGDMVQISAPREEWRAPLWLVTHVDLHRTAKVQAFLTFVKERAKDWSA
ncbi:LysR family transcriptional regulator [Planktotalea arctica]|uniref:LysR family transcriptional regulator n=1 Tax=Planktotalea arctica TaxID=1481893 RepID=UPI000A177300|nr:LysR family transcriptional regulator [Planktotalea arctica]